MFRSKEIENKIENISKILDRYANILTEIKSDMQRLKTLWELDDFKINTEIKINEETWKKCKTKSMSRYQISTFGRVKSPTGRILTPSRGKTRKGINRPDVRVNVKVNGKFTTKRLDKLIAETYFNIDPSYEFDVLHKDGDVWNNKIDNLSVVIK